MMRLPSTLAVLAVSAAMLTCAAPARAQTAAADVATAAAAAGKKKKPRTVTFKWGDHPSVRFGKTLRVDFTGRVQEELNHSEAPVDKAGTSSLDIGKRRLGFEGTFRNVLAFQVEREFGSSSPWADVYVDVTRFRAVQVQAGKFKLPFSLDENTGATNLDFAYRSLIASQLAPGRDTGVMVHGELSGRMFDYAVGMFEHDGRNAEPHNPDRVTGGRTGAARLLIHPFAASSRFEDLRVGVAATSSWIGDGRSSLKGHAELGADIYQADAPVHGRRDRLGFELRWRTGPAGIRAEYIRVMEQRRGEAIDGTDLPALVSQGWYVSGTWAVTGETKSQGLERPRRPLFRGGAGAVELAARLERLLYGAGPGNLDATTSPRSIVVLGNRDRAATLGVNWYPVRSVKVQANLVREVLADPAAGPLPSQPAFWSRVLRVQIGF